MLININNLQKCLRVDKKKILRAARVVLQEEKECGPGCINICFTDKRLIRKLNNKFLGVDSPTDVLAFCLSRNKKKEGLLAEIAVCAEAAVENAGIFGTKKEDELILYVIHGILHVLGFDDHTKKQKLLMRKKEKEYVNRQSKGRRH